MPHFRTLPAKAQPFVPLRAAGSVCGNVDIISGQFLSGGVGIAAGCLFETFFVNHFIGTHPAKNASKLNVQFGFWNFSDNCKSKAVKSFKLLAIWNLLFLATYDQTIKRIAVNDVYTHQRFVHSLIPILKSRC